MTGDGYLPPAEAEIHRLHKLIAKQQERIEALERALSVEIRGNAPANRRLLEAMAELERERNRLKVKLCDYEGCQASNGLQCRLADECNSAATEEQGECDWCGGTGRLYTPAMGEHDCPECAATEEQK